jgi:hypothetical protein
MKCYMIVLGTFTDLPRFMATYQVWNSAEYARVKLLRAGTGEFQVVLVDANN